MAAEQQDLTAERAHTAEACNGAGTGVTTVFSLLGKRWTGVIIAVLMHGEVHFAELRRAIPGISERILSDRLSELTELGLVIREVHEGPPLRVSYRLTEGGRAMEPALRELGAWAETYLADGGRCPERYRR